MSQQIASYWFRFICLIPAYLDFRHRWFDRNHGYHIRYKIDKDANQQGFEQGLPTPTSGGQNEPAYGACYAANNVCNNKTRGEEFKKISLAGIIVGINRFCYRSGPGVFSSG